MRWIEPEIWPRSAHRVGCPSDRRSISRRSRARGSFPVAYGETAARIIVQSFKSWGLGLLLMASLGLLAMIRYRAMVP